MANKTVVLVDHVIAPDLKNWESVSKLNEDNSSALVLEMDKTLQIVKDYLKKLEFHYKLEKLRKKGIFNTVGGGDNIFGKPLNEQLLLGHKIMNKTKHLLFLEKGSDWRTIKPVPSLSTSPSDTSEINSSLNVMPSSPSNTSCYADELQNILKEFNNIMKPNETKSKSSLRSTSSKRRLQKVKSISENEDFLPFLTEHLAKTNHQLKFSILPTNNTSEHAYACRLLHLSVQGRGRDKITAKKNAVMNLVQLLIDLQNRVALPESVTPFTKEELNILTVYLCERENYIVQLKKICSDKNLKPPTFAILQSKPSYTVQCSALGQITLGSNEDKGIAKRIAAKRTIELFKKSSGV